MIHRECASTGRYLGTNFYLTKQYMPPAISHGVTYLAMREQLKEAGIVMGFDRECLEEKIKK
jgi:hypothetical protein